MQSMFRPASDILTAISSAKAGDVIIVKAGTYKFTDTIVINNAMNGKSGAYSCKSS